MVGKLSSKQTQLFSSDYFFFPGLDIININSTSGSINQLLEAAPTSYEKMCLDMLINDYNRILLCTSFGLGPVLALGTQEKTRLYVACFLRTSSLIVGNAKLVFMKQIVNQKMTLDSELLWILIITMKT